MESDPSLIEITGEDDSLIGDTPIAANPTPASVQYYFSCSPLQIPGSVRNAGPSRVSPTICLKDNVDVKKPPCSSPGSSCNKENINLNRSEGLKLNVDPQKMKRKKRGGGYNLRKSLAWDRAFFTEEGVLNPLELSMLSGSFGNSSGEELPVIHEEGRLSVDSAGISSSADLQVLEENTLKRTPGPNLEKRVNGVSSLTKHASSPQDTVASTPLGTPKQLSNKRDYRTGTKTGGCPRSLLFSSLKRPGNTSTTKAARQESKPTKIPVSRQESKLPKIPVSRPVSHLLSKSRKSSVLNTSNSKLNQTGQADNVQRGAESQGSLKNIKSAANKEKAGPDSVSLSAKSSLHHPRGTTVKTLPEVSFTDPKHTIKKNVNCGLRFFPAAAVSSPGSCASYSHDVSRKTGVTVPQKISGNLQQTQFQTIKPSGLRMPSPSLGFFSLSKASASNISSQKVSKQFNIPGSSIRSLQKFNCLNYMEDPRLLHTPGDIPKMNDEAKLSGAARILGSINGHSVASASDNVSNENMKLQLEANDRLMVEPVISCHRKSSELMKARKEMHNIVDDGNRGLQKCLETHKIDQICSKEEPDLLLQSQSSDQLKKDNNFGVSDMCPEYEDSKMAGLENVLFPTENSCGEIVTDIPVTNETIKHRHVKDKECISCIETHGFIIESKFEHAAGDIKQGCVITHNDGSSDIHDVHEGLGKCDELTHASASAVDILCHGDDQNLMRSYEFMVEGREAFESRKSVSKNLTDTNLSISESHRSEEQRSCSPNDGRKQTNKTVGGEDDMSDKLHVADVPLHCSYETLLVTDCDIKQCASEVRDQQLVVDNDNELSEAHQNFQSRCFVTEQASELNHDCSSVLESTAAAEEAKGAYGSDLNCSSILTTENLVVIQVSDSQRHGMAEQQQVKGAASSSVEMVPPVESFNRYIDTHFRTVPSLKRSRDDMSGAVTTCNSMVMFSLSKEEDIGDNRLKNNIWTEEVETKIHSDNNHEENETKKMNDGTSFGQRKSSDNFHASDPTHAVDISLKHQLSEVRKLKSCKILSCLVNAVEANEGVAEIEMCKDSDGNLLLGCSNDKPRNSTLVTDLNGQSSGQAELQTPSILVDQVYLDNHTLLLSDCSLSIKSDAFDEPQEATVSEHTPLIQEQSDVDVSEQKCSGTVVQVNEEQLMEDSPSDAAHFDTETDHDECSIDTHFGKFKSETISLESDSASMMRNYENCPKRNVTPMGEHHNKQNNAICPSEDEETTAMKQSIDTEKENNVTIKLPVNAVPFSDEWLAAMEAAGEEILTLKSGAVQNSPPDKSLPEPGPWSPVKRKHNQIGPFDCTKFINIPPPTSD
ncbi:hypothetical protein NMG60_11033894 [Bertholletia excelsa]